MMYLKSRPIWSGANLNTSYDTRLGSEERGKGNGNGGDKADWTEKEMVM